MTPEQVQAQRVQAAKAMLHSLKSSHRAIPVHPAVIEALRATGNFTADELQALVPDARAPDTTIPIPAPQP